MKILFHLAHPAQYHMYKHVIHQLSANGHNVDITINTKEILEELLIADKLIYKNILPKRRRNNKGAILWGLIQKDIKIFFRQFVNNYDVLVGTETSLAHIGWLFRKPVFTMVEDDASIIPVAAKLTFPFSTYIVSPESCNLGRWSKKKIAYKGFQKLAYLHPQKFKPNKDVIKEHIPNGSKYFLIRVSALSAYHDFGNNGLNVGLIRQVVNILSNHGRVFISTEKELPIDLKAFVLNMHISKIHHFLYYAYMFIGDSQSMCVESAVLGVPSVRYSDFAGRIGVLEELEQVYGLTKGISANNPTGLIEYIQQLLKNENLRYEWSIKRDKMLKEKINVSDFWSWLIENHPQSVQLLANDPKYQNRFI